MDKVINLFKIMLLNDIKVKTVYYMFKRKII